MKIKYSSRFKKDLARYKKNKNIIDDLNYVINLLANEIELPKKYRDHALKGIWAHHRECHIRPDVLLIYKVYESIFGALRVEILALERIGSHSGLFG
jgi:mRNA interferase YafQ